MGLHYPGIGWKGQDGERAKPKAEIPEARHEEPFRGLAGETVAPLKYAG